MNKGLAITGGVLLFVSILVNVISIVSVVDYRPTDENILHDTSKDGTTFEYDGDAMTMEVFAKGDQINCNTFEISINDYTGQNVFFQNCEGTSHPSYTYLGDLSDIAAGSYNITSDGDIVIVDASEVILPAFGLCGGSVCCLLGLILLIVGLVGGRKTTTSCSSSTTRWSSLSAESNHGPAIHSSCNACSESSTTIHSYPTRNYAR